mmetsp:Transcript_89026/g.160561  ORF Transcript_89026/g.160561 Transcript_89026/m.160561 type:complete len:92 (-) Transcript_89026:7-282(-)
MSERWERSLWVGEIGTPCSAIGVDATKNACVFAQQPATRTAAAAAAAILDERSAECLENMAESLVWRVAKRLQVGLYQFRSVRARTHPSDA